MEVEGEDVVLLLLVEVGDLFIVWRTAAPLAAGSVAEVQVGDGRVLCRQRQELEGFCGNHAAQSVLYPAARL